MARSSGEGIPVMDNGERREPRVISGPGIPARTSSPTATVPAPSSETKTMTKPTTTTTEEPAIARTTGAASAPATAPAPGAAVRQRGAYGASFDGLNEDGAKGPGLTFERRWTRPGVHPYDEITWEIRTANIGNESGKTVFEQKDVEVPAFWSQLATNVVVSKYFRGHIGTPGRETSVKQLIDRVVNTIAGWAETKRYSATEE